MTVVAKTVAEFVAEVALHRLLVGCSLVYGEPVHTHKKESCSSVCTASVVWIMSTCTEVCSGIFNVNCDANPEGSRDSQWAYVQCCFSLMFGLVV